MFRSPQRFWVREAGGWRTCLDHQSPSRGPQSTRTRTVCESTQSISAHIVTWHVENLAGDERKLQGQTWLARPGHFSSAPVRMMIVYLAVAPETTHSAPAFTIVAWSALATSSPPPSADTPGANTAVSVMPDTRSLCSMAAGSGRQYPVRRKASRTRASTCVHSTIMRQDVTSQKYLACGRSCPDHWKSEWSGLNQQIHNLKVAAADSEHFVAMLLD